jgi:UDP-3-O-[3-hydroxymyristoyl] N-acetylglucosamine deacetylase
MTLYPAEADHGIVFKRRDVEGFKSLVPARYDAVCDTKLGTTIANAYGTKIMTVEHLMAALWGCGVDNCLIELEGPEIPIMDGSSEPFVFLIECSGVHQLDAPRRVINVSRVVAVEDQGATAVIVPADHFSLDITINFDHDQIGTQQALYDFTETSFKRALCRARTFGFARDVEQLRSIGLAQGGSLANAVVLGDDTILNAEGLRYKDEFVRHKALDCCGDYYLAGAMIRGAVTTFRPGHGINNVLMRELLSNPDNYTISEVGGFVHAPAAMAAPMAAIHAG